MHPCSRYLKIVLLIYFYNFIALSFLVECILQGMQSEDGSIYYYLPSFNPYATGALVGVDGQCVGQQPYYSSSGYLQPPVSYGSEAMPCYSWDSTYVGDAQNGNSGGLSNVKYGSCGLGKSNSLSTKKPNGSINGRFSKSSYNQPNKSVGKVNSFEFFTSCYYSNFFFCLTCIDLFFV